MAEVRVEYRAKDGRLLFDADGAPVPRPGDTVTFPSGHTYVVSDRSVEHSPAGRPHSPHLVVVYVGGRLR